MPLRLLILGWMLCRSVFAGESGLTVTYQPLGDLGGGGICISQVTCFNRNTHSGMATQIFLISAPNIPPSLQPEKNTQDLNLASVYRLNFQASDIGDPSVALALTLDATKLTESPEWCGISREKIVRASLECLRLSLPEKLKKTPLMLECADVDKDWLGKIVAEFNAQDRETVFYE